MTQIAIQNSRITTLDLSILDSLIFADYDNQQLVTVRDGVKSDVYDHDGKMI